jgi:hypothetical protein
VRLRWLEGCRWYEACLERIKGGFVVRVVVESRKTAVDAWIDGQGRIDAAEAPVALRPP